MKFDRTKHDKAYLRNIIGFSVLLCICVASLGYLLVSGDRQVGMASSWVSHTHKTILAGEDLNAQVEGMLSSQRGYLLSGDPKLYALYEEKKAQVGNTLQQLRDLTVGNPGQLARIDVMERLLRDFAALLDSRIEKFAAPETRSDFVAGLDALRQAREAILDVNYQYLQEEYNLLNQRVSNADDKRRDYFFTLLLGGSAVTILLLLFNIFLFSVQDKRLVAERTLKKSEERFALAIDGTNDGIFDWDIEAGTVFFSRQFFAMLGLAREPHNGTIDDFRKLLHPDDAAQAWHYLERYLRRELAEYANTFRMQHSSGKWLWVNSRAKAIFNADGQAVRMVGANINITQMKEYQERLKQEKENADRANRAKSDFLAHMSHEIRTPLTAISGIADIFMANQTGLNDKQKQLVSTLHSSTSSLKDLVNDVLDFSKIESGELELTRNHFALGQVLEQVISIMSVNARQKGLGFEFDYESLRKEVFFGDRTRLRQVLINLIGNAIKFTEKGEVTVRAYKQDVGEDAHLVIEVRDTGIGVSAENIDIIFERFKQADSSVSRKYGGTGLGLPISRSLAKLMGGNIAVSSTVGEGSTFTLSIPYITTVTPDDSVEEKEVGQKLNDTLRGLMGPDDRLLIVEDYMGNIVVLSYILDEIGCNYDIAHTGLEGLNMWKEKPYDIILMDIQMPEMDGFTATASIRKIEREQNLIRTPIIGMTAHALVGDKDKCIAAGMDAYIPKPIVENDLKAELLKYIRMKKTTHS